MKLTLVVAPALALALVGATGSAFAQGGSYPPPPPGYAQGPGPGPGPGWDAPPAEFREFQQLGFHDGVEGARRDFENHRPPSPNNRNEFRHPHVPPEMRRDYRDGFQKGYYAAVHHMEGRPGWDGGPR